MNCFVCGKEKQDFEVWSNKLVIGITYDSDFQNNDIVTNMSDKDIICHHCIIGIQKNVKDDLDSKK
tara:strand:- start:882 stop:1079 length:198 start_codon:yes stop_codon:yes gene_type:complete